MRRVRVNKVSFGADGCTWGSPYTVKIVLLHGVFPEIYTIMQLHRMLPLLTHCDLLTDVTDKPALQGCLSHISNSLPSNLVLH